MAPEGIAEGLNLLSCSGYPQQIPINARIVTGIIVTVS